MWSQRSLSLPLPPTLLSFLPLTFLLPADILRLILILRFSIQNSLLIEIKFAVTPPPPSPHPSPLQVFVSKMWYLFVRTAHRCSAEPVGHGWFALILFWLWIICYDGWTYLVTSCPDICQSRPSVNRNVEKNERKCPGGGFTQSHTSSDRGTSRAVCLHFQRFISNTME